MNWTLRKQLALAFLSLSTVTSAAVTSAAMAEDWSQWRGSLRDGKSAETGLLAKWPDAGPKLLWQAKNIGSGYSTPSIVGEQLFVISNQGNEKEEVSGQLPSAK